MGSYTFIWLHGGHKEDALGSEAGEKHTAGDTGLRESRLVAQGRDSENKRPGVEYLWGEGGWYSVKHFSCAISSNPQPFYKGNSIVFLNL